MPQMMPQLLTCFEDAERALGPIVVTVFNATDITKRSILETTIDDFELMWRASALGGFLVGREAARRPHSNVRLPQSC